MCIRDRQETAGISRYHEGVRRLLRRHFNPQNFYLTAEGLSFFYPMYAIAPAMEGIPVFTLPYGQGGPAPVSYTHLDSAGRGEPPRVFWGAGSTLAAECSASAV